MPNVFEQNDRQLLSFIAATVETLRDEATSMREQMATKDELNALAIKIENLRDQMATRDELMATKDELMALMATKDELHALAIKVENMRQQMATKDDLARLKTEVHGDFEQVHLRFDSLERTMSTKFGFIETEVSRLRSALYLLAKDKPEVLRLLGQLYSG